MRTKAIHSFLSYFVFSSFPILIIRYISVAIPTLKDTISGSHPLIDNHHPPIPAPVVLSVSNIIFLYYVVILAGNAVAFIIKPGYLAPLFPPHAIFGVPVVVSEEKPAQYS